MKRKFLQAFGRMKVYRTPFFYIYNPRTFEIKGKHYYEARKLIQPGDILLRGYNQYLDGYFIPGTYSHAAIYIGEEKIIHAMTPDVQYTDLVTFMRCDRIAIVRPNIPTKKAIKTAKKALGTPYDYDFIFEDDSVEKRFFSCSELVYYCYKEHLTKLNWEIKNKQVLFINKTMFTPDDCLPNEKGSATLVYKA